MKKVLVANRGEIAIRIMRACYEIGIESVAIYSKEDESSVHRFKADQSFMVGRGKKPAEAYLDIEDIIRIAKMSGCDAVHPGYGFLAENKKFAQRLGEEGIIFIGPKPELLDLLGDKIKAKNAAHAAGLITIPGTDTPTADVEEIVKFGDRVGYPILIKAAHGGGGRGMRVVRSKEGVADAYSMAVNEAATAFGSGEVYLEKYLESPKHIEIQILGDKHGNVMHLFERDCSVQRRHQKVVEYAPCLILSDEERKNICDSTVRFMKSIGYENAGTVEYLYKDGQFYFIEVNPRIQVEHTVTELITGIDLVVSQLKVADGQDLYKDMKLPAQDDLKIMQAAIQCRITTEDPENNFMPDTGKINTYRSPGGPGIRLDTGNGFTGSIVSPYYDSMMTKLCTFAPTFEEASAKMDRALREFRIRGVKTNIAFLLNVIRNPEFRSGNAATTFIDTTPELFKFMTPLNRGNKALQYIADTTINGFPGIGQSVKNIILPAEIPSKMEPVARKERTFKSVLDNEGPDALKQMVLDHKKLLVSDLTLRDAHQSLIATRMRTYDMEKIAPFMDEYMPQLFSAEMWGGATFDTTMRFLSEDPWERLRILRKKMPNTLLQMLFRGANAVGYTYYPDNVIYDFIQHAALNGIDVFRIFDSLNWFPQIETSIRAVRDANKVAEAAICYTGDLLDPSNVKYNLKYYVDLAKEMEKAGAHIIAIKDMAGVLKPNAAYKLVSALKENLGLPVHVHSHDSSGNGIGTLAMAAKAGADIVDTALAPFSGGTSHPNMSSLYYAMEGDERQPDFNIKNVEKINYYWEGVRHFYGDFDTDNTYPQTEVYYHAMPGGQYTNLKQQAIGLGLGERWDDVKEMYPEVNKLFGDIVKVTPSSKVVGDMALFMVQNGLNSENFFEKGKTIDFPQSVISFFQGDLGQPAGGFPEDVREIVLKGKPYSDVRPGSVTPAVSFKETEETVRKIMGRTPTHDDVLSYLMYPKVFADYIAKYDKYGDVSHIDTNTFFHGMRNGEAIEVDLEPGKTLFIKLLQIGDVNSSGKRTLFFELNGQSREIVVSDLKAGKTDAVHEKAEPSNRLHIGATMPGSIVKVMVKEGQEVKKGDVLVVTESMKMETSIQVSMDAVIDEILVKQGELVETHDLLIVLKDPEVVGVLREKRK